MIPPIGQTLVKTPDGKLLSIRVKIVEDSDKVAALQPIELPLAEIPQISNTFSESKKTKIVLSDNIKKEKIYGTTITKTIFDDPAIGGKITLCVLVYGDYHDLHKKCINAVLNTTTSDVIDFRVASNEVCKATVKYLTELHESKKINVYYKNDKNLKKYPVQRAMWYDPEHPINTKWLIWFDDDTICDKRRDWLVDLANNIIQNPDVGMIGPKYFYNVASSQLEFMKKATWWRGRALQDKAGNEIPNGNKVHFITGSCFALRTDVMMTCGIPDVRINHNGGDWLNGAALWQNGFKLKSWNQNKQIVNWSSVPRRGYSEKHPGL